MEVRELNDQEQARRDKLAKYQELGIDPFGQAYDQKNYSIEIREAVSGKTHEEVEELSSDIPRCNHFYFIINSY